MLFIFVLLGMVILLSKVYIMWMKSSSSTVQAGRPVRPIQRARACSLTCCSTEFDLYLDPAAKAVSIDVCALSLFGQPDFCIGVLVTGIWMRRKQRQLLSIQSTSVKVMSCEYKIKCVCVYTVYYSSSNSNNSILYYADHHVSTHYV